MREQLTARAPLLTRKFKVSGGLAAMTLGELQGPVKAEPKFTKTLCKREHQWAMRRHTKRCRRCGPEETR
jgi:hypothetical protein